MSKEIRIDHIDDCPIIEDVTYRDLEPRPGFYVYLGFLATGNALEARIFGSIEVDLSPCMPVESIPDGVIPLKLLFEDLDVGYGKEPGFAACDAVAQLIAPHVKAHISADWDEAAEAHRVFLEAKFPDGVTRAGNVNLSPQQFQELFQLP